MPDLGQGSLKDGLSSTGQGIREIIFSNFPPAIRYAKMDFCGTASTFMVSSSNHEKALFAAASIPCFHFESNLGLMDESGYF
jgi:hypothetical protein